MLRIKKIVLQFAVFDVFKLFLANTRKSPSIVKILLTNREILKDFLEKLEMEGETSKRYYSVFSSKQIIGNNINPNFLEPLRPPSHVLYHQCEKAVKIA